MPTDKTLLNFRCPDDVVGAIDQLGQQRYPAINKNGCDRTKTLLDIIAAGIQALTDGSVVIPITSDVRQKDVRQLDIDVDAIKAELRSDLMDELSQQNQDNASQVDIDGIKAELRSELVEELNQLIKANNQNQPDINQLIEAAIATQMTERLGESVA